MQIPYSDYSEIQTNGDLQQIESRYRGNIKTTDREEAGLRTAGSRSVSGPHSLTKVNFNVTPQEVPNLLKVGDELGQELCYHVIGRKKQINPTTSNNIMKLDNNNHSVFALYYHLLII